LRSSGTTSPVSPAERGPGWGRTGADAPLTATAGLGKSSYSSSLHSLERGYLRRLWLDIHRGYRYIIFMCHIGQRPRGERRGGGSCSHAPPTGGPFHRERGSDHPLDSPLDSTATGRRPKSSAPSPVPPRRSPVPRLRPHRLRTVRAVSAEPTDKTQFSQRQGDTRCATTHPPRA